MVTYESGALSIITSYPMKSRVNLVLKASKRQSRSIRALRSLRYAFGRIHPSGFVPVIVASMVRVEMNKIPTHVPLNNAILNLVGLH